MTTSDPCGNEDCDKCYPLSRFKVSIERVQRIFYERTVKAATAEEALAIVNEGTAWPSSYDDRGGEVLEQHDPVISLVELEPNVKKLHRCWNDPEYQKEMEIFLAKGSSDLAFDE